MRTAIVVPMAVLCLAARNMATPLGAGMRMPAIALADQHGVEDSVSSATRCVLFSRDMKAAKIVQETLINDQTALSQAAGAIIVSDISGMPSLITKLFALPALRKRPYRILLDREGKVTADFPSMNGKVTVFHLDSFTIERIEYIESAETLRAVLRQTAATPSQPEHHDDRGD